MEAVCFFETVTYTNNKDVRRYAHKIILKRKFLVISGKVWQEN